METINNKFFKDKTIALFYGGRSPEHEVSIESTKTIYPILQNLFNKVYLIGVTKQGYYHFQNLNTDFSINIEFEIQDSIKLGNELNFIPARGIFLHSNKINIDLAFILIHGNEGEDGKLQGLLDIMDIKYTGVNATSSGICMYKSLANFILKSNNINTINTLVLCKNDTVLPLRKIQEILGTSLFIKSETTGSSVGITALETPTQLSLSRAIENGFKYSERVLIQPFLKDIQEMEVAILETIDQKIIAGGPGLVLKSNMSDVLSYEKKYGKYDIATMDTTLIKNEILKKELRNQAIKIFKILNLSGFCRIDFFYKDKTIYFNEINTIPGLTNKSHYPILIKSAGYTLDTAIYEICRKSYEEKL